MVEALDDGTASVPTAAPPPSTAPTLRAPAIRSSPRTAVPPSTVATLAPSRRTPPPGAAPLLRSLTAGVEAAAPGFVARAMDETKGELATIAGRALSAREALWSHGEADAVVRYGVDRADGHVGRLLQSLGETPQVLGRPPTSVRLLRRALGATRGAVASARGEASTAVLELQQVARRSSGRELRTAVQDLRDAARAALRSEGALRLTDGRAAVLAGLEAHGAASEGVGTFAGSRGVPPGLVTAASFTPGPAPASRPGSLPEPASLEGSAGMPAFVTESPRAGASATGASSPGVASRLSLTEDDLARLGSSFDPSKPPPQTYWTESFVNTVCDLGRQRGGVTDAEGQEHFLLAGRLLEGAGGAAVPLGAAEIAAALKAAGVPLEKVDPCQLEAASRYVSSATSRAEQQDKLRKALDNFTVLSRTGLPPLGRRETIEYLWAIARVPGHALQKLSDGDLRAKLEEVLAAVSSGPGRSEIKVGDHTLELTVGAGGQVTGSACRKPGFWSKLGGFVKKVAPIALAALSFVPVTAPFARIAQGAISLVRSIRGKSLIGGALAIAGMVAGGAEALARRAVGKVAGIGARAMQAAAAPFDRVARIANAASRTLQGVYGLRRGSLVGGLAAVGQGLASGIAGISDGVGRSLRGLGSRLGGLARAIPQTTAVLSGIQGYRAARRGAEQARRALQAAESAGDPRAIVEARERLDEAERAKTAALLGGAASLAMVGADVVGRRAVPPSGPQTRATAGVGLEAHLRTAAGGLAVASGVVEGSWDAAAASGLALGAALEAARGGSHAQLLNEAANVAQATVSYGRARAAESASQRSVRGAEARLDEARRSGSARAIQEAEADLARARRGAQDALVGSVLAADNLLQTAAFIGKERERAELARREVAEAGTSLQGGERLGRSLETLAGFEGLDADARAHLEDRAAALAAGERAFLEALDRAEGDPARIEEATEAFEKLQVAIRSQSRTIVEVAQARAAAFRDPRSASPGPSPGAEPAAVTSTPVGVAIVRPGLTVWEISMRTGVPVDRILDFNAQGGRALDPSRLEVGQRVYVPLGEGDRQARPRTAAEVQSLKDEASLERRFEGTAPPRVWSPEGPLPSPGEPASVADGGSAAPPARRFPPVADQGVLDFVWRDFDWRSVGETAFGAAADIGDSVGAFAKGLGGGLVDMATGAVLGTAELAEQGAKLALGSPADQVEAGRALYEMGSAAVHRTVESGRFLAYGASHAGDVLDAMAQLGIEGSAEQVGRATASAEGTVASLYGMAGPVRSLGRRISSETDDAAGATARTSAGTAGDIIIGLRRAAVPDDVPLVFREGASKLNPTLVHDDYVRWVLGQGAKPSTFETPWSGKRGLGTRRVDDFQELTGIIFEGNTTPWGTMTPEKLAHKLDQATADYVLRQMDPRVQEVVWFGTEPLPTQGLGGRLAAYLRQLRIQYWVVRP